MFYLMCQTCLQVMGSVLSATLTSGLAHLYAYVTNVTTAHIKDAV